MSQSTKKKPKASTGGGQKKPMDHQPPSSTPAAKTEPIMVTSLGREWTVDPASLDDYELLADLHELQEDAGSHSTEAQHRATTRVPRILRRLLGDQQHEELKSHLRDERGRVPLVDALNFFAELFDGLKHLGNR
ncbi:MAG: hypothetical protein FWD18_00435 [Micrococcales bacterium]|nr:hypothetical protein [Micrococcales bacterium]